MSAPPPPKLPPERLALEGRVRRWRPRSTMPNAAILAVSARTAIDDDSAIEPGDAVWIAPPSLDDRASPWALVELLPDPDKMGGAIVVVAPSATPTGFFSRLLGGERALPRSVRGAALLLKGYRAIGGGIDPASGLDLVWGE